ncbi:MAG: 50S ribosomal protein L9 [Planctomycetota bacterium]|nr:50S ribosomal protein L9 [Planctomycetota bacterium]
MKVLLRQNVMNLGKIGEVVDVKPGYARNYLLPQNLAAAPTEANLKAIEADKQRYLNQLAEEQATFKAKADAVAGKEITLSARANEEGQLYGSIGPAQIIAALMKDGIDVEAKNVILTKPLQQLDKYDVQLRFTDDISATIHIWVVPTHDEAEPSEIQDEDETTPDSQHEAPPDENG